MSRAVTNSFPAFAATPDHEGDLLRVTGLSVAYRARSREHEVLRDVTFCVRQGEAYGLLGESGCGKSTLALAIASYLPDNGRITAGHVTIAGSELASLDPQHLQALRAKTISMVYQDPSRALNPSLSIGIQVSESFETAFGMGRAEARERTLEMLERVRIAAPRTVFSCYPHELSGGMQQRVVIAMALASDPALLILDEPTTALDATVQADILELIAQLRDDNGAAVLFISHNLAVLGQVCSRIGVLYAGRLVEEGASSDIFGASHHPYTVALMRCLPGVASTKVQGRLDTIAGLPQAPGAGTSGCVYAPRCALAVERCRQQRPSPHRFRATHGVQMTRCHRHDEAHTLPSADGAAVREARFALDGVADARVLVLRAEHLSKTFVAAGNAVRALDDVSFSLWAGETLGLVGESGSGKTTLAKLLVGLVAPDPAASMELDGKPLAGRLARRDDGQIGSLQMVFQHPDGALNRAHRVRHLIGRALARLGALRGHAHEARLAALIEAVRLPQDYLAARTRQLSGGLKQRVAIARAFAGNPRIVVCDEPTSSLDVSVQAAILNLLVDLQCERQVSYLFISHDLDVVRYVSDRVAVLYAGRMLEIGTTRDVFDGPHHPYTEALLSAAPAIAPIEARRAPLRLSGERPGPAAPPCGCIFHTRCPRKFGPICELEDPPFADAGNGHLIRCHIPASKLQATRR